MRNLFHRKPQVPVEPPKYFMLMDGRIKNTTQYHLDDAYIFATAHSEEEAIQKGTGYNLKAETAQMDAIWGEFELENLRWQFRKLRFDLPPIVKDDCYGD